MHDSLTTCQFHHCHVPFTTPTTRRPGTLIITRQPYCLSVPLLSRAIHYPHHKASRAANNCTTAFLPVVPPPSRAIHYPHHKASGDANDCTTAMLPFHTMSQGANHKLGLHEPHHKASRDANNCTTALLPVSSTTVTCHSLPPPQGVPGR